MDDYLRNLELLMNNSNAEIDDLMKKYDAIETAVNNAAKVEKTPAPTEEAEPQDVIQDESRIKWIKRDSEEKQIDESPEEPDDDFREVVPEEPQDDAKKAVMLDPHEPVIKIPDIDLSGTGLVLAGGGGKGIYQVGMLKVLSEAGVLDNIVAISGVSIGAVNAVLYAMGIDKMEKVWDEIDMGTLFDFDEKQIAAGNTHFSRAEMNALIEKYMDFNQIRNEKRVMYVGTSKCAANYSGIDPTYGCTAEYFLLNNALDEDINNYPDKPTYILDSIKELPDLLKK